MNRIGLLKKSSPNLMIHGKYGVSVSLTIVDCSTRSKISHKQQLEIGKHWITALKPVSLLCFLGCWKTDQCKGRKGKTTHKNKQNFSIKKHKKRRILLPFWRHCLIWQSVQGVFSALPPCSLLFATLFN